MSPVAVAADRRFHRAQVKPARRRGAWRTAALATLKMALLVGAAALALSWTVRFAKQSPLLRVADIRVAGNQRISSADIGVILDGMRGENIFTTDMEQWRAQLLTSPWIHDASLRRALPGIVEVAVREEEPIAIGRIGRRLYLVDDRGTIIDEYQPQYAALDLPMVDGFSALQADLDANLARGALAARIILALRQRPDIASRLSQVDVRDVHNATVLLTDDPAQLRIGDDHFLARLETYLSLATTLRERLAAIDYVDLRFDGRVYVRPAGTLAGYSASGGAAAVSRVADSGGR